MHGATESAAISADQDTAADTSTGGILVLYTSSCITLGGKDQLAKRVPVDCPDEDVRRIVICDTYNNAGGHATPCKPSQCWRWREGGGGPVSPASSFGLK